MAAGLAQKFEGAQDSAATKQLYGDFAEVRGQAAATWGSLTALRRHISSMEASDKRAEQDATGRLEAISQMATGHLDQLSELRDEKVKSDYGGRLTTHMDSNTRTLPGNVVLSDQLTASRASIEARFKAMPQKVAKNVDFITHDQTVIAAHILAAYPSIPPRLANYVTAKIVLDRRHSALDSAPLPRPNGPLGPKNTFHLGQQLAFQQGWSNKLTALNKLF